MMMCALALLASTIVLDDLGGVDRSNTAFWDVTRRVGVTVSESASSSLSAFDAGGMVSDASGGVDLETRWCSWDPSEAIPFNSKKINLVLYIR